MGVVQIGVGMGGVAERQKLIVFRTRALYALGPEYSTVRWFGPALLSE
jgi:hypothetical protein